MYITHLLSRIHYHRQVISKSQLTPLPHYTILFLNSFSLPSHSYIISIHFTPLQFTQLLSKSSNTKRRRNFSLLNISAGQRLLQNVGLIDESGDALNDESGDNADDDDADIVNFRDLFRTYNAHNREQKLDFEKLFLKLFKSTLEVSFMLVFA